MTVLLNSWAILRYLEDASPAAEAVGDLLGWEKPLMSWINLGDVHHVLRRRLGEDVVVAPPRRPVTARGFLVGARRFVEGFRPVDHRQET